MKLLTKAIEKQLAKYPIYSQDGKGGKAQVICKFFNPCGSQTWYILEGEKQDDDYILFALLSITKAIRMENLEQYWEQSFSPIGRKFTEIRPNYQDMGETDSMVAALYWLELEMYNGGFLQFFCNWGYDAYLLAIKGLGAINATYTEQLLIQAYGIIQRLENDSQLQELWNIPKHLTENEITKLNKIDEEYWEDKENIMRLMLLKFHSDSVENIDNKA